MAMSDDISREMDLASFEVVDTMTPGLWEDEPDARRSKVKLKDRLMSAWNSVRYRGWPRKGTPRLSKRRPVCLLGRFYQLDCSGERESFRRAFSSLLWMTYRRNFPPLEVLGPRSDAGWGCMLRSAQMLLAETLLRHMMPSGTAALRSMLRLISCQLRPGLSVAPAGWTWPAAHRQTRDDLAVAGRPLWRSGKPRRFSLGDALDGVNPEERTHRRIVGWFGDLPSAPFSLHRLVELGRESGRRAGDWYGPGIAAHLLQKAVSASAVCDLQVCASVYTADVLELCGAGDGALRWRSLLLLVPVRLGTDALNAAYIPCVQRLLELRCCVGIIGGKPKHSLYFVGFQKDQLIYLDPHFCQNTVDIKQHNFPLETFHCQNVRKMAFRRMDPSCTLGFYARSRADFLSLCSDVSQALSSSEGKYPVFTFVEGHKPKESDGCTSEQSSSTDEFVLL
ncbi:hypothetical protein DNTS_022109 [Danionella cerebrum]|uniref:Cysteine protease n=1 Tax=Danionella cerebrum TaxID=2873325 RepID=A0A553R0K5_9TELE|nr:hypothetical protein DNTS_022109 [Danionella translucida]